MENIELNTLFINVLICSEFYWILKIVVYSIFLLQLDNQWRGEYGAKCSHTAKLDHVKTVGFTSYRIGQQNWKIDHTVLYANSGYLIASSRMWSKIQSWFWLLINVLPNTTSNSNFLSARFCLLLSILTWTRGCVVEWGFDKDIIISTILTQCL
jgi:hypothetical protein